MIKGKKCHLNFISRVALPLVVAISVICLMTCSSGGMGKMPNTRSELGDNQSSQPADFGKVGQKDPLDQTTIFYAAATGQVEAVEKMLRSNTDADERDKFGKTALFYAIGAGNHGATLVKLLLRAGANVNAQDNEGRTALLDMMDQMPGTTMDSLQALLDGGVDINLADKKGWTPLMVASDWDDAVMVEFLVNHGADTNKKRLDGMTALMIASVGGKSETVKVLLQKGADASIENNDGKTALMLAKHRLKTDKSLNSYLRRKLAQTITLLDREGKK